MTNNWGDEELGIPGVEVSLFFGDGGGEDEGSERYRLATGAVNV